MDRVKKIAVDFDDVLVCTFPILLPLLNNWFGRTFKLSDVRAYNLSELFGVDGADIADAYCEFDKRGVFSKLPVFYGAVKGLKALRKRGWETYVVTSRPEYMREQTQKYLDRYFDGLIRELYLAEHPSDLKSGDRLSKAEIVKNIGAGVLIDDCLQHILEAHQRGVLGLLFDYRRMYSWNKGNLPLEVKRVCSWEEIINQIPKGFI
jgi:hypothetical protein